MPKQIWKCSLCDSPYEHKKQAVECENKHCDQMSGAIIKNVSWASPGDDQFSGVTWNDGSKNGPIYHGELRHLYPKKLFVEFGSNNGEKHTACYIINSVDRCNLESSEHKEFKEWKNKRRK